MSKRVCCLYRVSTGKQVDYDSNNEADIPMQRKACHKVASEMGWEIVHEEQDDGVSGHKVRAENRDKIQIIKDLARKKKFDILLVFMFDRIGRIADETPFVVEWFVKNGIEVWSTQECGRLFDLVSDSEKDVDDGERILRNLSYNFDELISWAELYDEASFEKKKMIVNCLIKRVEVSRGYKLKIEFNIDSQQFMVGIDKVA